MGAPPQSGWPSSDKMTAYDSALQAKGQIRVRNED